MQNTVRTKLGAAASSADGLPSNPRARVNRLILARDWETLLIQAGELHGHFCPFLALGVRAGSYGLRHLGLESDGMEEVLSIVETNSCFSHGIQYSSGCTFGNNALIYRDYGKTAVTLVARDTGKAVRIRVRQEADGKFVTSRLMRDNFPEAEGLFDKVIAKRIGTDEDRRLLKQVWAELSLLTVKQPDGVLFEVEEVGSVELPAYAPIYDSVTCVKCGELVMAPKAVTVDGSELCRSCAALGYQQLDGAGLSQVSPVE